MEDRKKVDLHIHSKSSDGSLRAEEIIKIAKEKKLSAISITDHDTINEVLRVFENNLNSNIDFLSGVELNVNIDDNLPKFSFDILAYDFDIYDSNLNQILHDIRKRRKRRNIKIIDKMRDNGFDVFDDQDNITNNNNFGRPHIAKLLLKKGFVSSIEEAFNKYLKRGKPFYVAKENFSCKKIINIIKKANGVCVLAHPFLINFNGRVKTHEKKKKIEAIVKNLKDIGIEGLETYYTTHTPDDIKFCLHLAQKYNLLTTGGSDFHGSDLKKGVEIGVGRGNLFVPYSVVQNIKSWKYKR